ncbi:MAG: hypothetical protein P4L79_10730 [Legionella sp.]|uniref:hypothetical protein n=1 Tax=Legionella sp. TaxID=459 RepID=UPI002840CE60|nr:hypothetical protein [Legionella sp.]
MAEERRIVGDDENDVIISDEVVQFLRELRDQDITDIKEALELVHTIKVASHFFKWLMVSIFGAFFIISSFATSTHTAWNFIVAIFTNVH